MKPLAAIVRSSDRVAERQRAGTYHGDKDQEADVERYCKPRGLAFELLQPELDLSGGLPIEERPALMAAIEGVERGDYSGIVAANLKRLTRSRSGIDIWTRVETAGGRVHCAAEDLDTSTPNGRFIRDIFLADAVREREEHAERHAKRRKATLDAGMWRMRQLPRGYRFAGPPNSEGKFKGVARKLVIDPVAGEEVRQAAVDVLAGVPVVQIAERVKMTPAGVRAMLRNRVYLGELRDGQHVKEGAHEPILDVATFEAVAEALRHAPRPARRVADGPALLAGIIRCAGCGKVMTRRQTARLVYGCPVHHSGGRCPAPASITCPRIDEYVERLAEEKYRTVAWRGDAESDVGAAMGAVTDINHRIARVVRTLAAAGLDESDAVDELSGLREERAAAEEVLRARRARSRKPLVKPGDAAYRMLDATGRNIALRDLIERVVITRTGRGGRPDVATRAEVVWAQD